MAEVDASQIKAYGPGLSGGHTGKKQLINVSGASLGELMDGLSYSVDGPTNPEVMYNYDVYSYENRSIELSFVALEPGDYNITIKYKGEHVTGSPCKVKIIGDSVSAAKLISKVTVHGRASELGHELGINEFVVDCSSVKPAIGLLKVHVKGPPRASAHINIIDKKNGTFVVQYKPTSSGTYTMDIKIADEHIPHSPLKIRVSEYVTD